MKIRTGPITNQDTDEVLDLNKPREITRSMMHRILNKYQISHDVNWGYEALANLMVMNNIPFEPIGPGETNNKQDTEDPSLEDIKKQMAVLQEMMSKLDTKKPEKSEVVTKIKPELKIVKPEEKPKEVVMMPDGFPKSIWVVQKWCRDRNILFKKTDKRVELINKLKEYATNPDEYA